MASYLPHPGYLGQPYVGSLRYPASVSNTVDLRARLQQRGLIPAEMYGMQEASGDLIGSISATAIADTGSPTYARLTNGRQGIYYDTTGDYHAADVHGLGTSSGVYACIFECVAVVSGGGIMGRTNAGATDCCQIYMLAGGGLQFLIRDTGANSLAVNSTLLAAADGSLWFAAVQIDKTANTARARMSKLGATAEALTGDITGFGSLTAGTTFGFGAVPPFDRGNALFLGLVFTGTQCEGAGVLPTLASVLGFP